MELPEDPQSRALMGALGIFLIREIWEFLKGDHSKLVVAVTELTGQVQKLRTQMVYVEKAIFQLEKLKPDLDVAHERLRHLSKDFERLEKASRRLT